MRTTAAAVLWIPTYELDCARASLCFVARASSRRRPARVHRMRVLGAGWESATRPGAARAARGGHFFARTVARQMWPPPLNPQVHPSVSCHCRTPAASTHMVHTLPRVFSSVASENLHPFLCTRVSDGSAAAGSERTCAPTTPTSASCADRRPAEPPPRCAAAAPSSEAPFARLSRSRHRRRMSNWSSAG